MHLAKRNFFEVRSFVIRKISRQAAAVVALVLSSCLVSTMECRAVTTFRTLYTFTSGNDGGRPYVGMIFDGAGDLYGTAYQGGTSNVGVVFELAPNGHGGWSESVLHSFSGDDGSMPDGVLVFDTSGNLYGTTLLGGAYGDGTVFELSPNGDGTWTESVLHSFNGADGFAPEAGVILDKAGDLYGTASGGGTHNGGVAFKLSHGTWTETVLHSFDKNGTDGYQLSATLVLDKHGNLYGTTVWGGNLNNCTGAGCGIVFRLSPKTNGTWKETILHSFSGNDGAFPTAPLIFDKAGNLYGTTQEGGNRFGTVFELSPNSDGSWTESVLLLFGGMIGAYPQPAVVFDQMGNLYGTTTGDGGDRNGTVFELSPNGNGTWTPTVLHSFSNRPGSLALGGLIVDKHRKLYGTTAGNDRKTFGSAFQIIP